MQTNHLEVYKQLAAKTGKSEQVYKDIGSFIFKETSRLLNNPSSLILKLKGVGAWHLRKSRLEIVVNEWTDRSEPPKRDEFMSEVTYKEHLDKHLQYINFKERLKEYERYLEVKRQVREKRHETQVLLRPDPGENGRFKSR